MAAGQQRLGTAFLFVNTYRECFENTLPEIDGAAKDFWHTFHILGFDATIFPDLRRAQFKETMKAEIDKLKRVTTKYVVFFFIGHGGEGDTLLMEDGESMGTKNIVDFVARELPSSIKVFFIDACRGEGLLDPYCPSQNRVLLFRSTLPYRKAHTGGTYGMTAPCSSELIVSMVSLQ